jgi:aerobic carbon-monoxide dehydrogenase medium subunit
MPASFDWVFADPAAYDCSLFDSKAGMTGESHAVGLNDVSVLVPSSADEAVAAFGDGTDVTVVAGGTVVMPDLAAGRLRPKSALLLGRAGLAGITRANGKVTIGAATPVSALTDGDAPLAQAAKHIGDIEVRSQATVGGNVCAISSDDTPRGDLQAALLALGATVRSAGKGGERSDLLEDFLADGAGRLVLDVTYDDVPRQAGYAAVWRPHTHHYTILAVAAARRDGDLRIAATGVAPRAVLLDPESPLAGLELRDDTLASAWYRTQLLPRLVARVLADLEEDG